MIKGIKFFLVTLVLSMSAQAAGDAQKSTVEKSKSSLSLIGESFTPRERMIGKNIQQTLEQLHYRRKEINDNVSVKAFDEFIKKLDYGKQFLLRTDVSELSRYKKVMDDQFKTGKFHIVGHSQKLMKMRIEESQKIVAEILKKKFDFTKDESLEVDPEKRKFPRNKKDKKELWRKILKNSTLNSYLSFKEEQKPSKKDKKEKKKKTAKKKEKKLTDAELRKKAHDSVAKKYKRIFDRMLKDDRSDYLEKYFNSVTSIFDPHTIYMTPKKKEDFDINIGGSLEGIGAVLQEDGPHIKVVKIVPGGAAWRQKELEVDDVIMAVGQGEKGPVSLVDMRVDNAVRYIRGKKGTEVRLTVKKADGSRKIIPIIRDVVRVGETYAKSSVIEHKKWNLKVGYIHLPMFYRTFNDESEARNCTNDVREEVRRLKKKNVDAIILDLRNNGGGALEDARQMSGLFIKKGPIVQVKDSRGQVEVWADEDTSVEYDGPLIVMTNRFSASASEILAGAMQDYGRALIVGGEYSHGKGTVQIIYDFDRYSYAKVFSDPLGAMKFTAQKFYRVSGESTQFKGITPDIILPDSMGYTESREQDLDYALPWDKIKALPYKKWKKFNIDKKSLISKSQDRVKENQRFKKILDSVEYLKKRRSDTIISLNLKKSIKEDEENKKTAEKLKYDEENKNILVSNFEESLRSEEKIRKADEKKWKEDFKQRKEEWVSTLRKDAMLEETFFIAKDLVEQVSGKKVSMVDSKK